MALVGDVLLSARELFTDLPQTLDPPSLLSLSLVAIVGPTFPAGTYFLVVTQLTPWGESLSSAEQTITLGAPSQILVPVIASPAATAVRIYWGATHGSEFSYQQVALISNVMAIQLTNAPSGAQLPPQRTTAYLPDTDGPAVGAFALYRWFNQALAWAAVKNRGGLPDFGAVATISGQPNYVLPGYWKKIDSAWFDGEPLGLLSKNNVFRREPVPGFSGSLTIFQATDRLMVEAWPQPDRNGGSTTVSIAMTSTDDVVFVNGTASFELGFGLASIGSEIVNYAAVSGNHLTGLIRGMCGTIPTAHQPDEVVSELNLMIAGYRVPSTYTVGSAASTLYLPPGWDEALTSYLLYRFRKAEQDENGAKAALQEATEKLGGLSANRIIAGPRQIVPYSGIGPETAAGFGSAFGSVIIP